MQRRDALKLLLAGGVLPAVPADLFGFFRDSHPASGYALRTLDAHQNDTVIAMIDQKFPQQPRRCGQTEQYSLRQEFRGRFFRTANCALALLR